MGGYIFSKESDVDVIRGRKIQKINNIPKNYKTIFAKICIVGMIGSGKTSFFRRLILGEYDPNEREVFPRVASRCYECITKTGKKEFVKLEFWDPAREEKNECLAPMFYRGSLGSFIFFGLDSRKQFEKSKKWIKELNEYLFKKTVPGNIVLVGSKCDIDDSQREITSEEVGEFLETQKGVQYIEISSKNDYNISMAVGLMINGVFDYVKRNPQRIIKM